MEKQLTKILNSLIGKIEEIEHHAIEESELSKLSRKQIYYLDKINQLNNPTLGELAIQLKLSKPSITAIIDRFAQNNYLKKVKSDEDRRCSHIHLTEKGKSISELHVNIHTGISEYLMKSLSSSEIDHLVNLLEKALK